MRNTGGTAEQRVYENETAGNDAAVIEGVESSGKRKVRARGCSAEVQRASRVRASQGNGIHHVAVQARITSAIAPPTVAMLAHSSTAGDDMLRYRNVVSQSRFDAPARVYAGKETRVPVDSVRRILARPAEPRFDCGVEFGGRGRIGLGGRPSIVPGSGAAAGHARVAEKPESADQRWSLCRLVAVPALDGAQ
jgi:hypothetical protein